MSSPAEGFCNPACRAKIILNGGRVAAEAQASVQLFAHLQASGIEVTEKEAYKLIEILDTAEDLLIELNNLMLSKTGYKRRTPKAKL
jgi:hypothetical protein